jgi:polysaccharide deacetylase family protein (PEP-CTERM system associated)
MLQLTSTAIRPRIVNAMSVDVEDYFQVSAFEANVRRDAWDGFESRVCRNTERILELFDRRGVRATFFILGWVAERFPGLVQQIVNSGHEAACHGHEHRLVYAQSPEEFRQDIRRAKKTIEDAGASEVSGYRAPSYSITRRSLWAIDVLIEEGFRYDSSIYPIHHDRYGIPGAPRHPYLIRRATGSLWEVPGSTVRMGGMNFPVGGGGYFRILPYAWTRWGFSRLNQVEERPGVFYLHPWEIDPDQPRVEATAVARFRHYRNLSRTETRLMRLLDDFRFDTVKSIVASEEASAKVSSVPVGIPLLTGYP